jgi:hypothetical protein
MNATDMTRYIIAATTAARPDATVDQLVQFAMLDQAFRDGCDAGTASRRALQAQLSAISEDTASPGRLSGLITVARDKLRLVPASGTKGGAGSAGAAGGGAQRRRRMRAEAAER